jgi:MscS family membrane protein
LVSVPNQKVISSSVDNVSQSAYFRRYTTISLRYDTPAKKLERAVGIIQDILQDHEGRIKERPPKVLVEDFNEWSANIAIYAWYHPAVYWSYRDWVSETCMEIRRRFDLEAIEFASLGMPPWSNPSEPRLRLVGGDK